VENKTEGEGVLRGIGPIPAHPDRKLNPIMRRKIFFRRFPFVAFGEQISEGRISKRGWNGNTKILQGRNPPVIRPRNPAFSPKSESPSAPNSSDFSPERGKIAPSFRRCFFGKPLKGSKKSVPHPFIHFKVAGDCMVWRLIKSPISSDKKDGVLGTIQLS
jgi:hypothetical protein